MLVGIKDQLAIEWERIPSESEYVFARFCLWANNQRIGNWDDVLVLGAVKAQVERALKYANSRHGENLLLASRAEAMKTLCEALYGDGGTLAESERFAARYSRFDLSGLGVSAFDGLHVFLIDGEDYQRLLWREIDGVEISEAQLPRGEWDKIASEFMRAAQ